MSVRQALARGLVRRLPAHRQVRMAADTIAWLYADQPPDERKARAETLAPRLLERIQAGQIGLRLVLYYHLLRLPALRRLRPWILSGGAQRGRESGSSHGADRVVGASLAG